jgi:hypothetical protein
MLVGSQAEDEPQPRFGFLLPSHSNRKDVVGLCWSVAVVTHRLEDTIRDGTSARHNPKTSYAWRSPKNLELKPLICNQLWGVSCWTLFGWRLVMLWSAGLDCGSPTAAVCKGGLPSQPPLFRGTAAAAAIGFHEERIWTAGLRTCRVRVFVCWQLVALTHFTTLMQTTVLVATLV